MVQTLAVALIVASAAVYSTWSLMPAGVRRSVAAALARQASRRLGIGAHAAQRVEATLASAGACSDCSSCKGCAPGAPTPPNEAVIALPRSRRTGA